MTDGLNEPVEVTVRLMGGAETDKAWGVTDDTQKVVGLDGGIRLKIIWLPKSQVEITEPDRNGIVKATMPEWLAIEKGLV